MRVLFIGGTGNISEDCAAALLGRGHEVWVLTRGRRPVGKGIFAVQADRRDKAALEKAVAEARPEVVLDFLAYEPAEVEAACDLLAGRVRQYVFISTTMVYAKPHRRVPLTEDAPLGNPWSEYARKKEACEDLLRERLRRDGFPATIVRPSHTYSRRWIPNLVSSKGWWFAARLERGEPVYLADDGANPWTLTATADFAGALAGLAGNDRAVGEAFHITSDEALPWNVIYQEIAGALGVREPRVERIPTDFICERFPDLAGSLRGDKCNPGIFDNAKLQRLVPGFRCRKPFRAGIRESVAWLRSHPEDCPPEPELDRKVDAVVAAWRAAARLA